MARPVKCRRICALPKVKKFIPSEEFSGETVKVTLDEFEAIRLIDYAGLSQEECARQMNVARTTVQAVSTSARAKIAQALVNGSAIEISGGSFEICPESETCCGRRCRKKRLCPAGKRNCPGCGSVK